MSSLPTPVRVSPLIKLCRWTLLIAGIYHGAKKQSKLAKKEAGAKEAAAKEKAIRDKQLAIEKAIANEKELEELAKLFK